MNISFYFDISGIWIMNLIWTCHQLSSKKWAKHMSYLLLNHSADRFFRMCGAGDHCRCRRRSPPAWHGGCPDAAARHRGAGQAGRGAHGRHGRAHVHRTGMSPKHALAQQAHQAPTLLLDGACGEGLPRILNVSRRSWCIFESKTCWVAW